MVLWHYYNKKNNWNGVLCLVNMSNMCDSSFSAIMWCVKQLTGGVISGGSSCLISSSLCMYCKRNDSEAEGYGTFAQGHLWWRQSSRRKTERLQR